MGVLVFGGMDHLVCCILWKFSGYIFVFGSSADFVLSLFYKKEAYSYGTSLAIWDHTVLPATRHK